MLPLILSFLGSTAAGAGLLGTGLLASPLIAGAIGSGLGTAVETGDLGKGLQAGLLGGLGGAAMGSLMGGASGSAMGAAAGTPATAATAAATNAGQTVAQSAAQGAAQGATQGAGGFLNRMLPGGSGMGAIPPAPGITGATFGERFGQIGSGAGQASFGDVAKYGFQRGAMTGAGMGAALAPSMLAPGLYAPEMKEKEKREFPQADPATRQQYTPSASYRPGRDGEQLYFDPYPTRSRYAGGGLIRMAAGGLADMPQGDAVFPGASGPQMNERELVSMAIKAIRSELPEEAAAMVLAQFVQTFGEDALRKVVEDVQSGRVPGGDMEGQIKGPGDGMDDLVPAAMDDGSSDVLLSDGEFIVPADVVSGLGNGSTDAGASELENMMGRVRQTRTGMREQPKQVAAGGLLPA